MINIKPEIAPGMHEVVSANEFKLAHLLSSLHLQLQGMLEAEISNSIDESCLVIQLDTTNVICPSLSSFQGSHLQSVDCIMNLNKLKNLRCKCHNGTFSYLFCYTTL